MTKTVYTMGYARKSISDIQALADEFGADIFDIRYSPRSRRPGFDLDDLSNSLGERYTHVRDLGNANYRGYSVRIANFEAGRRAIDKNERPVILMCACGDPQSCHRTHIGNRLRELGYTVLEIDTSQPTLF